MLQPAVVPTHKYNFSDVHNYRHGDLRLIYYGIFEPLVKKPSIQCLIQFLLVSWPRSPWWLNFYKMLLILLFKPLTQFVPYISFWSCQFLMDQLTKGFASISCIQTVLCACKILYQKLLLITLTYHMPTNMCHFYAGLLGYALCK